LELHRTLAKEFQSRRRAIRTRRHILQGLDRHIEGFLGGFAFHLVEAQAHGGERL
jgi:hypothetical protein